MSAPILTAVDTILCPHGGRIAATAPSQRVLVSGVPVLTVDDVGAVQGCPVPPPGTCLSVRWGGGAMRVLAEGRPVLLQGSSGHAVSAAGAANGPVTAIPAQARVLAT